MHIVVRRPSPIKKGRTRYYHPLQLTGSGAIYRLKPFATISSTKRQPRLVRCVGLSGRPFEILFEKPRPFYFLIFANLGYLGLACADGRPLVNVG